MPTSLDTVRATDIARDLRVAPETVKRWIVKGLLQGHRNAAGHWFVARAEAERFIRERQEQNG
jgi:hypothetical protein